MKLTPVYLFDIDGTLADCSHRLHHILKHPKDWPAFFAAVIDDAPIPHMVKLVMDLDESREIVFVSGRSDECRGATVKWLEKYLITAPLYMRKAGDHRDDDIIKIELLTQIRDDGFDPIMVFEDRKRVVDAWRAAGVPCAQVADGNF